MRKFSVLKEHTCLYTYRHIVNSSLNKHQIGKELVLWYQIRDGKLFHIIYFVFTHTLCLRDTVSRHEAYLLVHLFGVEVSAPATTPGPAASPLLTF